VYLGEKPININEIASTVQKRYGKSQTVYVRADKRVPWKLSRRCWRSWGSQNWCQRSDQAGRHHPEATLMPYADAFDQREPLGKPFLDRWRCMVVCRAPGRGYSHRQSHAGDMGDKEPGGGTTTVVHPIPMMPRSGPVNRVANDIDSQVPQAPPQPKPAVREKAPEPDAIPLRAGPRRRSLQQ